VPRQLSHLILEKMGVAEGGKHAPDLVRQGFGAGGFFRYFLGFGLNSRNRKKNARMPAARLCGPRFSELLTLPPGGRRARPSVPAPFWHRVTLLFRLLHAAVAGLAEGLKRACPERRLIATVRRDVIANEEPGVHFHALASLAGEVVAQQHFLADALPPGGIVPAEGWFGPRPDARPLCFIARHDTDARRQAGEAGLERRELCHHCTRMPTR
jgi:hypothetical protein